MDCFLCLALGLPGLLLTLRTTLQARESLPSIDGEVGSLLVTGLIRGQAGMSGWKGKTCPQRALDPKSQVLCSPEKGEGRGGGFPPKAHLLE